MRTHGQVSQIWAEGQTREEEVAQWVWRSRVACSDEGEAELGGAGGVRRGSSARRNFGQTSAPHVAQSVPRR
jgi:hypothetical protein